MEKDPMIAQVPLNYEEETDSIVSEEADAEEVDQAEPSPLPSMPESAISSTFATNTIDIRLQIQPEDGHPDGRRIRNVISVNGKTLRIGALRANQLNALITLLRDLDVNQAMEHFAQFLAMLSKRQQVATTQPVLPSARSSPAAAQAPLLEASPTPTKEEKAKEPDQGEPSRATTTPGNISTTSTISRPVAPASKQKKEAPSPKAKPEQLALF